MSDQINRVLLALREEIANGLLAPGARLVEAEISMRLGVSRTPVRPALRLLEAEGLLEPAGGRGYRVRFINADRIRMSVLARGTLEGLAAREIAIRGISEDTAAKLRDCLRDGDNLLAGNVISEDDALGYNQMNIAFHAAILDASESDVLRTLLEKSSNLPFAGTSYLAYDRSNPKSELRRFQFAHAQHHIIVAAILNRDSGRAEALMREHANNAMHYVELFRTGAFAQPHFTVVNGALQRAAESNDLSAQR